MTARTFLLGSLLAFIAGMAANQQFRASAVTTESIERAIQQINAHYIVEPRQEELERGAINGMVGALDDYSELLSPEAYERLLANAEGTFAGVGIEIGLQQEYFTVLRIIPESPAAMSALEVGDRITAVDGISMKGLLLSEVIETLRGPAGSKVSLVLRRTVPADPTTSTPSGVDIELTLIRAKLTGA